MDIVVLAGGLSSERDVSFKSGEMVSKALRSRGHRAILLDVFMGYGEEEVDVSDFFDRSEEVSIEVSDIPAEAPDIEAVKAMRKDQSDCFFGPNVISLCRKADIVFLALHGADGEDGKIQAAFDLLGVKYTGNDYLSCAIAMDKGMAKQFMRANGVPCPMGFSIKKSEWDGRMKEDIHFPIVVKPACGGSSIGVSIVGDSRELEDALDKAFLLGDEVVVEEYIKGREFAVGVIEGTALPVIEIAPKEGFYDYKNKYKAGATVETCPADLEDEVAAEMQLYAERVTAALGLESYSRMDFLMDENENIYCLEANTLPGMTPTSLLPQEAKVVGMEFADLCEEIIHLSL